MALPFKPSNNGGVYARIEQRTEENMQETRTFLAGKQRISNTAIADGEYSGVVLEGYVPGEKNGIAYLLLDVSLDVHGKPTRGVAGFDDFVPVGTELNFRVKAGRISPIMDATLVAAVEEDEEEFVELTASQQKKLSAADLQAYKEAERRALAKIGG